MLAAVGADHILMILNKIVHLIRVHGIHIDFLAGLGRSDQLVSPLTGSAALAVHQRIGERTHVAGSNPSLGIHNYGSIQAHVVLRFLHELLQPRLFDIVLEFHAQRAVVPRVGQTAVNLRTCINIASVLAQIHNHIQCLFTVIHHISSICWLIFSLIVYYTEIVRVNQVFSSGA